MLADERLISAFRNLLPDKPYRGKKWAFACREKATSASIASGHTERLHETGEC